MEGIFATSQYDSGVLLSADSADFADGKGEKRGENCVAMWRKKGRELCSHVCEVIQVLLQCNFPSENSDWKGSMYTFSLPRAPQILLYNTVCIIAVSSVSGLLAKYFITFCT